MFTSQPAKSLFFITLMIGLTMAISSNSWLITWVGLELNLLSFIPIITSKTNTYSAEAALKYFLVQALASAFLVSNAIAMIFMQTAPALLILTSLLLKLGAAPLHFWLPPVMQGIPWLQCLLLMTIQKFAPLALISYLVPNPLAQTILQSSSILSSIVGAAGGLNQTLIRKIMAYSSITHMSWVLAAISYNVTLWLYYMTIYSLITSSLIAFLNSKQMYHFKQIFLLSPPKEKAMYFMSFLSLGGLPPFLGFFPKMMIVMNLASMQHFFWLIFLLSGSLLTLFFYIRMVIGSFVMSSPKLKIYSQTPINTKISFSILMINFFSSTTPLLFMNFTT